MQCALQIVFITSFYIASTYQDNYTTNGEDDLYSRRGSLGNMVINHLPALSMAQQPKDANTVEFVFQNHCPMTIWVGVLGNLVNGVGMPEPSNGGFVLEPQREWSMKVNQWGGRFWARFGCDGNGQNCLTGDCGDLHCKHSGEGDVTLLEITTKGTPDVKGMPASHDFYDVSYVDAFNLPATIKPINGRPVGTGKYDRCTPASCLQNLNDGCPDKMKEFKRGQQVACLSACANANRQGLSNEEKDKYCCSGQYNVPQTCPGSIDNRYFKDRCPDAYSFAYDDQSATFHCVANQYYLTWC